MAEEHEVEQGDERSSLAPGDHVRGTEVGYDGNAQLAREDRGLAGLPGAREFRTGIGLERGLVVKGLAMAADEGDLGGMALHCDLDGFSVGKAETPVQAS